MRNLKFRIWDKVVKSYVGEDELYIGITFDGKFLIYNDEITDEVEFSEIDNYIVEQYTGLKDKNGKEIYEGDILGGVWEGGYIAWCDKCNQFQYHISTNECMACLGDVHWHELVEDDGELEVIGNIHENGDLFGGEE